MSKPLISNVQAASESGPLLLAAVCRSDELRSTPRHRHSRGQLLGSVQGLVSVDAGRCRWVVPATHAVWVPPGVSHGLQSHGPFSGWSVYVAPSACAALSQEPCVLAVSGLLSAAVVRAATWTSDALTPSQERLARVILDEISESPQVPLGLSLPKEPRLLKIARALSNRPDDGRGLDEWAQWAGIAPRTLSRRFIAETGFSFTEWRQRLRLLRALELLAAGRPVTAIALDLGYGNVSAFIAMFRRYFGVTPGRYEGSLR